VSSLAISLIVFVVVFGGALFGMALRRLLPEKHLGQDSKDVIKLGMGLVGTLSALVLGLLVASAKSSFDAQRAGLAQLSANIILLDRALAHYGTETDDMRKDFKQSVATMLKQIWSEDSDQAGHVEPSSHTEGLYERIHSLAPKSDVQRSVQSTALKIAVDVAQARWMLAAQKGSSIPTPFLIVLVFWLVLLFTSFGLFSWPNATVIGALLLCALSVAGAIFLILELDRPFHGLIQIPRDPLQRVFEQLGRNA